MNAGRRRTSGGLQASTLERLRDRRFRRHPGLRVRSDRSALTFVNAVGFCSTFYRFPEGVACLWEAVVGRPNPRWPRRSHHDDGVGLTWQLKDTLPSRREVYYGKLIKGRPLLVALDVFPAFYGLTRGRQRARDYRGEYDAGHLKLIERFVAGAVFTNERILARLFRLPVAEITGAVERLVRSGTLTSDEPIDGWPGRWLVHASAQRR